MLRTKLLPLGWLTLAFLVTYRDGDGTPTSQREKGDSRRPAPKAGSRRIRGKRKDGRAPLARRHLDPGMAREAREARGEAPKQLWKTSSTTAPPGMRCQFPRYFTISPCTPVCTVLPQPQPQPPPPLVFLPPSLSLLLHFAHTSLTGAPSVSHIRVPLASSSAFNRYDALTYLCTESTPREVACVLAV